MNLITLHEADLLSFYGFAILDGRRDGEKRFFSNNSISDFLSTGIKYISFYVGYVGFMYLFMNVYLCTYIPTYLGR
jgi:hypothetical protein